MSLNHSPQIVTNGLVLYYDMANTTKSWRGAPVTNLYYAVNNYLNGNGNHWVNSGSCTFNDNDTSIQPPTSLPYTSLAGIGLPSTLRITSAACTATGNAECGMNITSVSASTTYTISIWLYIKGVNVFGGAGSTPYMRTSVNNNSIATFSYNGNTD